MQFTKIDRLAGQQASTGRHTHADILTQTKTTWKTHTDARRLTDSQTHRRAVMHTHGYALTHLHTYTPTLQHIGTEKLGQRLKRVTDARTHAISGHLTLD